MERVVCAAAALLAIASLLIGCGEPASELPEPDADTEPFEAPDFADYDDVDLGADVPFDTGAAAGAQAADAAPETGEALYGRLPCAGCHEGAGPPGTPVVPLQRLSERYTVEKLAAFLAAPPPPMPPVDLDDEQRRELARFLLAAHP